jgi:hypothetical protein
MKPDPSHATHARPTRWAMRLRLQLAIAIAAKLALLALLYVMFFSPSQRPPVDASAVASRLLSPG